MTSTLHQKLKYPVRGKIVTVQGEEEYMVSHLNSFRYIEMDGEFIETPFQHFEEVPQTLALAETVIEDPPLKMASLKDARAVIEKGEYANWGQLPDSLRRLTSLVSALLQRLKGFFGTRGLEDLLCTSVINE